MSDLIRPPGYNDETINTGDLFNDVVDNIAMIFENAKLLDNVSFSEVFPYDNTMISSFPTICVVWSGPSNEQFRTIGRIGSHQTDVSVVVWYYHAEAIEAADRRELARAAHSVCDVIRKNRDCNGYSNIGMSITAITPVNRVFETKLIKAVKIDVIVPVSRRLSQDT